MIGLNCDNGDLACGCAVLQPAQDMEDAQAAIRAFIEEHGIREGLMPTNDQLASAGQAGLKHRILRLGGMKKVAASMGLVFPAAEYPTLPLAVEALKQFAQEQYGDASRAPSFTRLQRAGRYDLVTSYRKFGQSKVLEAAGMTPNAAGRQIGAVATKSVVCNSSCLLQNTH